MFFGHFMAFFGPKMAIMGSPSNFKCVEHWLNSLDLFAPKNWRLGALEPPKNDPVLPEMAIFGQRQSRRTQIGSNSGEAQFEKNHCVHQILSSVVRIFVETDLHSLEKHVPLPEAGKAFIPVG